MDVILELLKCDPAHLKLWESLQPVLRIGVPWEPGYPVPRPGDTIILDDMDLTVHRLSHNWNDSASRLTVVVYPELPVQDVEELYWGLFTGMETRRAEKLPPRILWVQKDL